MKTKEVFTRRIEFVPGYDFIIQPTKKYGKEYGRHGMTMKFLLEGKKGVIQFVIYTNWLPMIKNGYSWEQTFEINMPPMAADIGYHAYKPQYKGQVIMNLKCPYLHNKKCYYDGSSLQAEAYMAIFFNKGEEKLYKEMEKNYKRIK